MNHTEVITKLKNALASMQRLRDESPVSLWADQCGQLEDAIADMEHTYQARLDEMPEPSDYDQHNTMNHRMQGAKHD